MAQIFLRNTHRGDEFDLFLVSAVTGLLSIRLYLQLAGYPQIGHGGLHVAHMLFGGLFMLASLIMLLGYVGQRVQRLAAIVGGLGFGVFIDEIGKFITRDNNYFFQPTIAIIYAIFVVLFLLFRSLRGRRGYTPREYLLGALLQLEEVAQQDMDSVEQKRFNQLLDQADPSNPLTAELKEIAAGLPAAPPAREQSIWTRRVAALYRQLIHRASALRTLQFILIVDAVYVIGEAIWSLFGDDFTSVRSQIGVGQLVASLVAGVIMALGVRSLSRSRLRGYELIIRAILVNLFITQFFSFYHEELVALPGFVINLFVFLAVSYALRQERRGIAT